METLHEHKNQPGQTRDAVLSQVEKKKRLGLIKEDKREWGLKNDMKRVILYESYDNGAIINNTALLNPTEAILLSLFDGKRTTEEVIRLSSDLFQESHDKAEKVISHLIKRWENAIEEKRERSKTTQYNPAEFVMPSTQVDMERKRFYIPIGITFRVTGDCMRDCIYCNIERVPNHAIRLMPLERWDELAEESKQMKLISVILTGGDPFMHPDFLKIVECFTKRGIHPFIVTKSFVSKEKAQKLAGLGIHTMQVSIDAAVPQVVDFLTQSHGAFEQAVDSIKNLQDAGITVSTNTVITSYNILLFPDLVRFLVQLGVKRIRHSQFGRSYYKEYQDDLFIHERAGIWLEQEMKRLYESKEIPFSIDFTYMKDQSMIEPEQKQSVYMERAVCSGGRWGFIITADGTVIPCDEIPATAEYSLGNVSHQSIMDVWESPQIDKYLNPSREYFQGTICYTCDIFDPCHQDKGRCYRDALKAYGSLYAPTPSCWKAPKGIRLT